MTLGLFVKVKFAISTFLFKTKNKIFLDIVGIHLSTK